MNQDKVSAKYAEALYNAMEWEDRIRLSEGFEEDALRFDQLSPDAQNRMALMVSKIALMVLDEINGIEVAGLKIHIEMPEHLPYVAYDKPVEPSQTSQTIHRVLEEQTKMAIAQAVWQGLTVREQASLEEMMIAAHNWSAGWGDLGDVNQQVFADVLWRAVEMKETLDANSRIEPYEPEDH